MEEIGYIKYKGNSVDCGYIDAKTAGNALVGFDEAIRFFNEKQSPSFAKISYDIPVKIEKGSWVAIVMAAVGSGAGVFAFGYLKKAGEKLAENDFKDVGLGDVFKKSISALQSFIRISKHTQKDRDWDLSSVRWSEDRTQIGIMNENGDIIFIPYEHLNWFNGIPHTILPKMTNSIDSNLELSIGIKSGSDIDEVTITSEQKNIFTKQEEHIIDDTIFPEFRHGDDVRLEGKLRRGNESSNSLGFEFQGHMINCVPETGTVVKYKEALFEHCIIVGTITRYSKNHRVPDKRPTIIISHVIPLTTEPHQKSLF
jgi:hypothetical protein